ncbi:MAG: alcohol dehydrogenase catalytic domain-containing protein [Acidobacteria bacterium]|nr:alcohol dehydrogenase catalytic domain-containing protein [Acidobacteriota bacterium]
MKAYRIVEWERPPQLTEAPVPEPGPGEVVVRVAGNGLCHSDVGMTQMPGSIAEMIGWRAPFTLGHEVGGHVAMVGAGVVGFAEGDAVAVVSPHSCGTCRWCVSGRDCLCDDSMVGRGYGIDGGLARYVLVSSTRELIRLDGLDPLHAGPLTDAGSTSMHAVKRALHRIPPGGNAVVIGAGGLGAFAIQFLRELTSARIIAVDRSANRLAYARELGAATVMEGVTEDTAGDIGRLTGGGADAVFDFVGIDSTIAAGLRSTGRGGAYALVGAANGTLRGADWFSALPKDGEVFTFQASNIADALDVFALADAGRLQIDIDVFPLDRVAEAYEQMEAGELRGRAVVVPD